MTSLSAETSLSAQAIFYLLRLSCGDADVFWKYRNRLLAQPSAAGNRGNVRVDLGLIRDHITHSAGSNDVCFELGRLYMGIGDYQTALELFEESNDMVSQHHVTWFNMGVCAYFLEDLDSAKRYFSKSLQLKSTFEESKRWLQLLTEGNLEALRVLAESMQRSLKKLCKKVCYVSILKGISGCCAVTTIF
ncbi:uncharacterized protein [Blastocystis hominis]|uniref:Uncharacterized protein n=1 Tax=Blastocystis hominis TaxID=12968 RepID=D8M2A3_BLAHO|nr:uncharacterized protein [Blastocystis hominis]CBK22198.2 unnamed protein product [Blastocystis hominis]|eukprot:XP_012896246.1 uncharacterized protein [Blastocystis hominis]